MSNIMSAVSRFLTPEVVGQMASACGLDAAMAQKAVNAAVPSILSGLVDVADKPGGARMLAKAVSEQPTDLLSSIASSLTGSAQMAENGTGLLSSLLSGGALGILTSTVAKFLGVSEGSTRTLMGLLTPVIMGVLGREQGAAHLGANGLTRMLTEQKDAIAAALPPGLGKMLEASRLRDNIAPISPERRAEQVRASYPRSETVEPAAVSASSGASWPYWVLPLLAVGALLWFLLPSGDYRTEPTPTAKAPEATKEATKVATGGPAYIKNKPDNWVSIGNTPNSLVNQDIYNRNGDKIGTIKDLLVGPDGRMAAAVINIGRELGIGDKDVGVPYSSLELERRDGGDRIVITATRETLHAAPAFEWKQ
jgi:sporulation protein YlmC with PRC-barrel domain